MGEVGERGSGLAEGLRAVDGSGCDWGNERGEVKHDGGEGGGVCWDLGVGLVEERFVTGAWVWSKTASLRARLCLVGMMGAGWTGGF